MPASSSTSVPMKAVIDFPINSKFLFAKEQAAYVLTIEIQSPIDIVILKSPVHLDLVDSGECVCWGMCSLICDSDTLL